jgi:hypothetical protein
MPDGRELESGGIAGVYIMEIRRQRSRSVWKNLTAVDAD